ncbi:site-specific integrase [Microcoleus sp. FACHB-1515]|uniref:tyrosine-type recombinase/integrase n=1 Tax=Cyanophyceae TaxID=3028117 RepID=UPI001688E104|nr:site-specific integrase [Microcoleus sp. FACHB-1515]MBD2090201.1 site-specific integrase [Microcoleus sp. FACHB-1515]
MKVDRHGQAKVLSQREIAELFEVGLQADRDCALIGICFFTGCRINEACTMLASDAYDATGVRAKITIRKQNTKGKQETRQIATSQKLKHYLAVYREQTGQKYLFAGRHGRGHLNSRSADAILRSRSGTPRSACDRVGLVGVSPHSFRRTALTQMSSAGVPLRVIQEISGHRSLQALQKYLEVSEQQVEQAMASPPSGAALTF